MGDAVFRHSHANGQYCCIYYVSNSINIFFIVDYTFHACVRSNETVDIAMQIGNTVEYILFLIVLIYLFIVAVTFYACVRSNEIVEIREKRGLRYSDIAMQYCCIYFEKFLFDTKHIPVSHNLCCHLSQPSQLTACCLLDTFRSHKTHKSDIVSK